MGKAGATGFPKTRRLVFEDGKPKYPFGWVVEVWSDEAERFEDWLKERKVYVTKIGKTIGARSVGIYDGNKVLASLSLDDVREAWSGKLR